MEGHHMPSFIDFYRVRLRGHREEPAPDEVDPAHRLGLGAALARSRQATKASSRPAANWANNTGMRLLARVRSGTGGTRDGSGHR